MQDFGSIRDLVALWPTRNKYKKVSMIKRWLYGFQDGSIVGGCLEKEIVQVLEVIMLIKSDQNA